MTTTTIPVEGMHCNSCETLISEGVSELPGVSDVRASHKDGKVTVTFEEGKTTLDDIRSAIRKEGYTPK